MCQVLLLAKYLIFESWVKGVTRRRGSLDGEGPCSDLEWWAPALAVFRGIFRWKTSGPHSTIGVSRQRLQQLCKHSVLSIVIQHEALTTVVSCPRAGKFTLWFHLTIQTRVSSGNQRILTKKKKKKTGCGGQKSEIVVLFMNHPNAIYQKGQIEQDGSNTEKTWKRRGEIQWWFGWQDR